MEQLNMNSVILDILKDLISHNLTILEAWKLLDEMKGGKKHENN